MIKEELQFEVAKILRALRHALIDIDELQLIIKDARFADGRMDLQKAIDKIHLIEWGVIT